MTQDTGNQQPLDYAPRGITPEHRIALREAKQLLEHPGWVAKISNILGTPMEKSLKLLPAEMKKVVHGSAEKSLAFALNAAIFTIKGVDLAPSNRLHKAAVTMVGAVGGAFGLPALAVELPIATTIMLRSIADIARSEGEHLACEQTQLACLQVFALGGPGRDDDASDAGYFGIRAGLAKSVSDASRHLARKGLNSRSAPALTRLISQVATRFSIPISEKVAAQAVPFVGAAGGAAINAAFIEHYQRMARGHFIVRRLERLYGEAPVRALYQQLETEPA